MNRRINLAVPILDFPPPSFNFFFLKEKPIAAFCPKLWAHTSASVHLTLLLSFLIFFLDLWCICEERRLAQEQSGLVKASLSQFDQPSLDLPHRCQRHQSASESVLCKWSLPFRARRKIKRKPSTRGSIYRFNH